MLCLLNILYGQLSPNDHSVRLNKQALLNSSRSTKDIMYLPQFSFIPKSLTLNRIFNDFKLDFSEFINEFPEFKNYFLSKLKNLSGGEQRIVEIYLIISSKTKFCLLDEPFTHVMPLHVDSIKNLILREKKNKGIIITDHLYRHITDICDDLYVINDGKTYLTNSIQDLETLGYATFTATNSK